MPAIKLVIATLIIQLLTLVASAVEIEFPPEELPSEVVTPILDSKQAVRSKLVNFSKHFEFQGGLGFFLDEPFYQNNFFGLTGLYHFGETWGMGVSYFMWQKGLSNYASQFSVVDSRSLRFERAKQLESAYVFSLHQRLMYGKISWSKGSITPMSMNALYEAGMGKYGERQLPFFAAGIGHRIFFNLKSGFVLNLKLIYKQIVDPLSQDLSALSSPTAPDSSSFTTKYKFGSGLDLNFFYIF